jgi:hypothetical protein
VKEGYVQRSLGRLERTGTAPAGETRTRGGVCKQCRKRVGACANEQANAWERVQLKNGDFKQKHLKIAVFAKIYLQFNTRYRRDWRDKVLSNRCLFSLK